jgi:hypothetical protein
MEIILVAENIVTDEKTLNYVHFYICDLCSKLNYSHEYIYKIIFADENNYGNEIKKIDPDEDYTDTSEGKGFGKTIYIQNMNKSVIIMRSEIYQGLIQIINYNVLEKLEIQFIIFIILHEIGHCINHSKQKSSIKSITNRMLKIYEVPKYYFEIIIDEYNANKNIVELIKKEWVLYDLNHRLDEFNTLGKNMLSFQDISFVQNIWYFFKRFMDIGVFLVDYELSEYSELLSGLNLPFDIKILISLFVSYNKGINTSQELFNSLTNIVNDILDSYYKPMSCI